MKYDLIIIGAGPGGYEMAAEAAQHGRTVAIVERDNLGGTCLNRGCIPTKALCRNAEVLNLIHDAEAFGVSVDGICVNYAKAVERKDAVVGQLRDGIGMLLNNPQITVLHGEAKLVDDHTVSVGDETAEADNIVIATGSAPKALPIEGAEFAMNSDDILAMTTLPNSLCVIGGGVIGMEFAGIFSSFGVEVSVVEFCKEILPPFDKDVAKRLRTVMGKRGVDIKVGAGVKSIAKSENGYTVTYEAKGKEQAIECEAVLMAVGRKPVIPEGVEALGIEVSRRGIEVNDNMQTSIPSIYAIGDVNGRCMLAHAATAHGMRALAAIEGKTDKMKLDIIPSAVFTTPEMAMVGITEEQCKVQELDVTVKKGFFRSNGKALAMGETEGLVKMIVDNSTRQILGCHICGPHAADLIQEVVMAMNAEATIDVLTSSVHGHPTLGEVILNVARQF
ncbi:MAG: dihydrolipoyl dehydrogenase [Bacteroidales bacterium]|nr:dihydrolipoyl dehydrogenase [Bacteroidales bacterium]